MRILMMADVAPNPDSGAAGTEWQTARALRELGHDVTTLWKDDIGRHRIRHGNLHYLLELPKEYERAALDAMQRTKFDIVHVNQPHGFRAACSIHLIHPGAAFIHRSHGFELHVEESLRGWRERFGKDGRTILRRFASGVMRSLLARHAHAIAREADGHIVSSSLDAEFMIARLGVPRDRIAVVAQGAPESFLNEPPPTMAEARLRRILHVSQFAFFKAPMITAAAFNSLAAEHPRFEFTWVCDRRHHGDVRALLQPITAARTALLHWMPQDELIEVYDRHGIFIFPSFYEGFGKTFLEAMSRGLCVVASDVGGAHDVITSGVDGALVPVGNAPAIVEAVRSLSLEKATLMSSAAAETARRYAWERVARETAAHYERWRKMQRISRR